MSPDGPKNIPPEEKLLRLIRGKGPTPAASPATPTVVGARSPAAANPVASNASGLRMRGWTVPSWWLLAVNVLLGGFVAVELILLVVVAARPAPQPPEMSAGGPADTLSETRPSSEEPFDVDQEPMSGGLRATAGRPLFQPTISPARGSSAPAALSQEAKTLAGRLNVIGLVDGDPPQAIIEDSQTQKTYFVSVGQQVTEGLVVSEIRQNRVMLDLDGQTIELSL